jgi:hypothetical protein
MSVSPVAAAAVSSRATGSGTSARCDSGPVAAGDGAGVDVLAAAVAVGLVCSAGVGWLPALALPVTTSTARNTRAAAGYARGRRTDRSVVATFTAVYTARMATTIGCGGS